MEPLDTSAEMQACDRYAIDVLKIPGLILMENAGRGVVEMTLKHFGPLHNRSVVVFCGKGNNGGDGFVAARHLLQHLANVTVYLAGKSSELKGDAKTNYEILKRISRLTDGGKELRLIESSSAAKLSMLRQPDVIIDALFGTGFSREIKGAYKSVVEWINRSESYKVSIDIPSGIDADDGSVHGAAVFADLCVTMGMKKIGLIINKGRTYTGLVETVDTGVAGRLHNPENPRTLLLSKEDAKAVMPARPKSSASVGAKYQGCLRPATACHS